MPPALFSNVSASHARVYRSPPSRRGRFPARPRPAFGKSAGGWRPTFDYVAIDNSSFLSSRQPHVTVTRFPAHFRRKPLWRLKEPAVAFVPEFNCRNDQPFVSAAINIDLNRVFSKWNIVARFCYTTARRRWPLLLKLIAGQMDVNFLSPQTAT